MALVELLWDSCRALVKFLWGSSGALVKLLWGSGRAHVDFGVLAEPSWGSCWALVGSCGALLGFL